ncbi:hypothetical protein E3N88_44954 [Mikania micrantha]|uniref:Uncharacterized protein n=1 Tax=Mikania micrantha TaxID=192012 RepID=A0A5N6LAT9_9ASTR|nr:hypothetical protein E3N88_44954 [Mikania micrantha]
MHMEHLEKGREVEINEQKWVYDSSYDHRGRTPLRASTGAWKASVFIIAIEFAERLSYFGIATSLIIYLTKVLHQDVKTSAKNANQWIGVCNDSNASFWRRTKKEDVVLQFVERGLCVGVLLGVTLIVYVQDQVGWGQADIILTMPLSRGHLPYPSNPNELHEVSKSVKVQERLLYHTETFKHHECVLVSTTVHNCWNCRWVHFGWASKNTSMINFLITIVDHTTTKVSGKSWFGKDLNSSRLDHFYLLLAVITALNLCVYVLVTSRYSYKNVQRKAQVAVTDCYQGDQGHEIGA